MALAEIVLMLCMITFVPGYCEANSINNQETTSSKLISQLTAGTSAGGTEETKKLVKRLAPEKNGEYQMYQGFEATLLMPEVTFNTFGSFLKYVSWVCFLVFFGNAELLKEWLKGAGVTGQPGVDFPALTTIPATSFSCRGLKGGYYADLETNCQVFHICDNGRKISFLCPNGTIFQQSQLICDWWFKVDCSKSVELYEQSSEQLAEEERKRTELRKSKFDYHSAETDNSQDRYDVQNLNYDGKQNGRINPYDDLPQPNQIQSNRERAKSAQHLENNHFFNEESVTPKAISQHFASGTTNTLQNDGRISRPSQNLNYKQHFGQYNVNTYEGGLNKQRATTQDYSDNSKKGQSYYPSYRNSNSSRDEKVTFKKITYKNTVRTNSLNFTTPIQRVTPAYTESTTFRVNNPPPIKESQQFAESAAFVSNRGNLYNDNPGNSRQFYYQLYRDSGENEPKRESVSTVSKEQRNDNTVSTQTNDYPSYTEPTFIPDEKQTTVLYETTTQYPTTTLTLPCNTDDTIGDTETATPQTLNDSSFSTESYTFSDEKENREENLKLEASSRNSFSNVNRFSNDNSYKRMEAGDRSIGSTPSVGHGYGVTELQRQNSVTPHKHDTENTHGKYTGNVAMIPSSTSFVNNDAEGFAAENSSNDEYNEYRTEPESTSNSPTTVSQRYQQNSISVSTKQPLKSTLAYQENSVTEKDLSPYDRSFTYKQGKVLSTISPYIPFTKNYAYTTSHTILPPKPTTYSSTVSSSLSNSSVKNLIPKLKQPFASTNVKINASNPSEREHALNMLQSLRGLESRVPSLTDASKNSGRGSSVQSASGPSTLHSLALYFSTATDNFDSNETTDSTVSIEYKENEESRRNSKDTNETVEIPKSILTQHTIASYSELFKLNNALETNNVTSKNGLDLGETYAEEYGENLDMQESGAPLDADSKTNGTKLRELAQVFTHALSAYLLDPGTFKKVLTEIRPTEPPEVMSDTEQPRLTIPYSLVEKDYTSVIREKDEVLNFSDDDNELSKLRATTTYPTTTTPFPTTRETTYDNFSTLPTTYYTTIPNEPQDLYVDAKVSSVNITSNSYRETFVQPTENTLILQQNRISEGNSSPRGESEITNTAKHDQSNYFSSDESVSRKRVGGFQNNGVSIVTPYDRLKFSPTTLINDNSVESSTPSSSTQTVYSAYYWGRRPTSKKPDQQLTPPFFESYDQTNRRETLKPVTSEISISTTKPKIRSTTTIPVGNYDSFNNDYLHKARYQKPLVEQKDNGESLVTARTSHMKFKNNYNRIDTYNTNKPVTTTVAPVRVTNPITTTINEQHTTPYVTTDFEDSFDLNNQKEIVTKLLNSDHWTSSPTVTQLWETSVFVDPKRINHGLESEPTTIIPTTTDFNITEWTNERIERTSAASFPDATFASAENTTESFPNDQNVTPNWQRSSRNKDSPTAFTLLPAAFPIENTATPSPVITTRSSITTTITSSVTSTNSIPQETLISSLLPFSRTTKTLNETENEIADKLFGQLNSTSTNTLMKVMKLADSNETVRQLVLLLITHCTREPMNRTMQREKDQLLNTLLRMPVDEFTSNESRNIVAGINELNLPIKSRFAPSTDTVKHTTSTSTASTLTEPPITTFRSRRNRKFRTTTESSANLVRRSDKTVTSNANNSLADGETTVSDNRALELLRSLYTIATKWG